MQITETRLAAANTSRVIIRVTEIVSTGEGVVDPVQKISFHLV